MKSNSWVITVIRTGQVFETWNKKLVDAIDREKCAVETAHEYLCRINKEANPTQL